MKIDLKGRTALVTGGAVRIGRTLALRLAECGADVAISCRDSEEAAQATVRDIEALGVRAAVVRGELADAETPARLLAEATAALGAPDILVNNASLFRNDRPETTGLEDWSRMHRVNLRAPMLLSQAFAGGLPEGVEGDIINLNDIRSLEPRPQYFAYTQSKAALHALTGNLAAALAPRIRVNEIALGAVLPPASPPDAYQHVRREALPLGRFPTPDDVADALVFFLGCRAVTGQTLRIDGGQFLAPREK
jgi:NAD(P)-dependent dehydrogenase (short-subunit alcohol dehydrogenase family)